MIVLDACVLIAHLDDTDRHHDRATHLLSATDEPFAASALTLAEVLVGPARAGQLEVAHRALQLLGVTSVGITGDVAASLALLRVKTRLKMPDCCALLAAVQRSARLATFDERLAAAARDHGVPVLD